MTETIWEKACDLLSDKTAFVIATIISHTGSTPRTAGTKMIVTGDGGIVGTVGGGLLEARVMEKAVEIIERSEASTFMPFDLTYEDVETMDMICGGKAEVFLDHIRPTVENRKIFERWRHLSQARKNAFFVTVVSEAWDPGEPVRHGVMGEDMVLEGSVALSAGSLETIGKEARKAVAMQVVQLEDAIAVVEPSIKPKTAFLFGAGHVARPTAHLCSLTGFYVTVLDDRKEFADAAHFPDTHDVVLLDSFENAFSGLAVDEDAFIVIFTRGHLHDRTVLAQALRTPAAYVGMIGSRKKRDAIYGALLNAGFGQEDIERVHSPIGMAIGAQSPEEIAVSIVSEMILERSRLRP